MPSTEEPKKEQFVLVKTTAPRRPIPPNSDRLVIATERLNLRPFDASDLDAFHVLRTQPEVMKWTGQARIDRDKEETKAKLDPFLPPNDQKTYNYAICLRETGELIGIGGCHNMVSSLGWPEVGYMFKREHWGKGYGTEFVQAWLKEWERLPREDVELSVDARSIVPIENGRAREVLIAVTVEDNPRSHNILGKCGFEHFVTWTTTDPNRNEKIALPTFRYFPVPRE